MSKVIEQLELFSETATRVHNSGFVKDLKNRGKISYEISGKRGARVEVMKSWPEEDLVNGFLLPFRMLIQKNDPSSWRQICNLINSLEVPDDYKIPFREARRSLNEYLDKPITHLIFSGAPENRREILLTFIYGYYAHADPQCREKLELWKRMPVIYDMLEFEFMNIIISVSDLSWRMSEEVNKPLIDYLKNKTSNVCEH